MKTYTFMILKNYPTERQYVITKQKKKGFIEHVVRVFKGR